MSILTREKILAEYNNGRIVIDPFDLNQLSHNSYDVRLAPTIKTSKSFMLDTREQPEWEEHVLPDSGLYLTPFRLYLASTIEKVGSDHYVADMSGKSILARFGIQVHMTAGWGETGFKRTWTCEISCVQPVKIYPGMLIAQVRFQTIEGKPSLYDGKYKDQVGAQGPIVR